MICYALLCKKQICPSHFKQTTGRSRVALWGAQTAAPQSSYVDLDDYLQALGSLGFSDKGGTNKFPRFGQLWKINVKIHEHDHFGALSLPWPTCPAKRQQAFSMGKAIFKGCFWNVKTCTVQFRGSHNAVFSHHGVVMPPGTAPAFNTCQEGIQDLSEMRKDPFWHMIYDVYIYIYTHRIHGAGIYANIKGVYWW